MQQIKALLDKLTSLYEELIKTSVEQGLGIDTRIVSKYAEIWVAHKLRRFEPQIGRLREKISADIYLKSLDKRIEVKYSILKGEWRKKFGVKGKNWGWGFGNGTQFKNSKFDLCVLIAAGEDLLPKDCYIIPLNDFKEGMGKARRGGKPQSNEPYYGITIFEDKRNFERWKKGWNNLGYPCKLEETLNEEPNRYRNKWDLILEKSLSEQDEVKQACGLVSSGEIGELFQRMLTEIPKLGDDVRRYDLKTRVRFEREGYGRREKRIVALVQNENSITAHLPCNRTFKSQVSQMKLWPQALSYDIRGFSYLKGIKNENRVKIALDVIRIAYKSLEKI